jgi:hypothetical protein
MEIYPRKRQNDVLKRQNGELLMAKKTKPAKRLSVRKSLAPDERHWAKIQENLRLLLLAMIEERGRLKNREIAQICGWYLSDGNPDQARISSYRTGQKFSMPAYIWIFRKVFGISEVQMFAAASSELSLTLQQTELNDITDRLSEVDQTAVLTYARALASKKVEIDRLTEQLKRLRASHT